MKKLLNVFSVVFVSVILSAFLIGCGKDEPSETTAVAPAAPVSSAVAPSTSVSACWSTGRQISAGVCEIDYNLLPFHFEGNVFPRLNPSEPSGPYAFSTGITAQAGDKLNFTASGGWGGLEEDSWLGIFTVSTWGCNTFNLIGVNTSHPSEIVYWEEMRAGLVGNDGSQLFLLGSSVNGRQFTTGGPVKLGLNLPFSYNQCASVTISKLQVRHCENTAGTTVVCP